MADFRQYYGLDFMTALYVTYTPRELYAMIAWLPDDSALSASLRGGRQFRGWTWDRTLALFMLEQEQMNGFNFVKANTDKKRASSLRAPDPIPFPGRTVRKTKNRGAFGPIVKALASGHLPPPDIK